MSKNIDLNEGLTSLIERLPFVMGAVAAILFGLISYQSFGSSTETYIRMAVGMVLFYVIGLYARSILNTIIGEIKEKKEKERKEEERARREKMQMEMGLRAQSGTSERTVAPGFEARVGDSEDFEPLTVSDYIKSNLSDHDKKLKP